MRDSLCDQPPVAAIVLQYGKWPMTEACVHDLLNQAYADLRILVVDNCSPDNSHLEIAERFSDDERVQILRTDKNLGYAQGNNFAVRWLQQQGATPRYLIIANNDIRVPDDRTVLNLVHFAEMTPDLAGVQPRVVLPDGFHQGPYSKPSVCFDTLKFLFPPIWAAQRALGQLNIKNIRRPTACYRVIGAFFLVDALAFLQIGMFDESTFLGREEDILAERFRKIQRRFYYYPSSKVIHQHDVWQHNRNHEELSHFREADRYYFSDIRNIPSGLVNLRSSAFNIYQTIFIPIRRLILSRKV